MYKDTIIKYHLDRLGLEFTPEAQKNLEIFTKGVFEIESSSCTTAINRRTSASGGFQFVKRSVLPALNRLIKIVKDRWVTELIDQYSLGILTTEEHRDLITSLTYRQQEAIFLADILEKTIDKTPGLGDKLIRSIVLDGSREAMATLYFRGHHTSPDTSTTKRALEVFNNGISGNT